MERRRADELQRSSPGAPPHPSTPAHPGRHSEVSRQEQARLVKAADKDTKVFVYRNLVKALPWFTQVRLKLEDPQWWGFFLRKARPTGPDATGTLYHDFEQTPRGDCGQGVECGEYLWNHSNGSMLTDFFVKEFVGGEQGMGSPYVDVRAQPPGGLWSWSL